MEERGCGLVIYIVLCRLLEEAEENHNKPYFNHCPGPGLSQENYQNEARILHMWLLYLLKGLVKSSMHVLIVEGESFLM